MRDTGGMGDIELDIRGDMGTYDGAWEDILGDMEVQRRGHNLTLLLLNIFFHIH